MIYAQQQSNHQHSHWPGQVLLGRIAQFILIAWSYRLRLMQPDSTFQRIVVAGHTKARSMFSWFLAEVYTYNISQSLANLNASSLETILSLTRSHLLPINTKMTSLLLLFFTSSTHLATFLKDSLRVISKTTSAAADERQYERVIALNSYWPAVSQICSLIILLLSTIFLQANSMPTVYSWLGSNLLSTNLPIMLVFPTAVSPTSMNLKEQSKRFDKSIFIILILTQNIIKQGNIL